MGDVLTKEQRHKNMKNIRAKDTKIEVLKPRLKKATIVNSGLIRYLGIENGMMK